MRCPDCHKSDSKVVESRDSNAEASGIRRRRQCLACGHRFTTYERIEPAHLMVVKKDGRRENFDRNKVAGGVFRAFEKRSFPAEKIHTLVDGIVTELRNSGEVEVQSTMIGELVMQHLLSADDVAYVRFASVYRSFTDLGSFEAELTRLRNLQDKQ